MAELETGVVTDVLLPLVLAIMMFGMGLATPVRLFKEVGAKPKGLLLGLVGQLVALPLLAIATVAAFHFTGMERDIAIGLLLLGALPGGATSNLLAHICRGDTALSIVLTAVTSITAILWTPAVLLLGTQLLYADSVRVSLSFADVMAMVLVVITIPVLLGIFVAKKWPSVAAAADRPFRIGGVVFLALLVAAAIFQNRVGFWEKAALTIPAALVLNLTAMGVGYLLGRLTDGARRRSIVIEVGFQNGTFGIVLATTQLESATAALSPAFYALAMFATGGLLAMMWARRQPDEEAALPAVAPAAG